MSEYLTAEQSIENAANDLEERDVDGVFGGRVRVRALSAAAAARVLQGNVTVKRGDPSVKIAEVEIAKFHLGVINPKLTADQVRELHLKSGPSFKRVLAVIDEISGMDEDEQETAKASFPGDDE